MPYDHVPEPRDVPEGGEECPAEPDVVPAAGATLNRIGTVYGGSLQVGDIHGDVHLHVPAPTKQHRPPRSDVSLRYYLYISDAKVDMLLPQVDPAYGDEFGDCASTDRVSRLERVVRGLEEHADLGTVDEPREYVRGVAALRWATLAEGTAVYFGGRTERTVVGLGGSAGHVLGAGAPPAQARLSASLPPVLLAQLAVFAAQDGTVDVHPDALTSVVQANGALRGPAMTVEFVARRMLHGPCPYPELFPEGAVNVLLASPLYVALAD